MASNFICFDFDIEFIKGDKNSIPDFLTREFLQDRVDKVQSDQYVREKDYEG